VYETKETEAMLGLTSFAWTYSSL